MNDYWKEKPDFWDNRTRDHKKYEDQKFELIMDINHLIDQFGIKRVVDVCGYKGGLRDSFPGVEYVNLDVVEGFDVTKDWVDQGFESKPKTLCFESLSLICFPPEQAQFIVDQMLNYSSDLIYLFEEIRPECDHGEKISDDYGGKWAYHWTKLFSKGHALAHSEVGEKWARIVKPVKGPTHGENIRFFTSNKRS